MIYEDCKFLNSLSNFCNKNSHNHQVKKLIFEEQWNYQKIIPWLLLQRWRLMFIVIWLLGKQAKTGKKFSIRKSCKKSLGCYIEPSSGRKSLREAFLIRVMVSILKSYPTSNLFKSNFRDWYKFNILQRIHLKYVENLSFATTATLAAGLF